MMKKENKILLKYFVLVFLVSALIINWQEISWFFNYKAVFGLISSFFERNIVAKTSEIFNRKEIQVSLKNFEPTDKENSVEIPKLGILVPLVFSESGDKKDVSDTLNQGVVYFPSSVLPGEAGQTIILGHSAPLGWPKIKYQWVFSRLNELTEGDEIFVYFNRRKYAYSVTGKLFLDRGEELPQFLPSQILPSKTWEGLTNSENILVLISCWPPGKDIKRIAVEAK